MTISLREYVSLKNSGILSEGLEYHKMTQKDIEKENFFNLANIILKELKETEDIEGFFLGTDIKIAPDFDVLRFSEDKVVNIDLKSKKVEDSEIIKKFRVQSKILGLLGKEYESFVYYDKYSDGDYRIKLFDKDREELLDSSVEELILYFNGKSILDNLIQQLKRSEYIIAPTENIDAFMDGKYFLTPEQEKCTTEIIENNNLYGINGAAGTGKTLIALDLVKRLSTQYKKNILFIFAGTLRDGHRLIEKRLENVRFEAAKNILLLNFDDYDYIIVDEAQRLREKQYHKCVEWWENWKKEGKKNLVFLYHQDQSLSPKDIGGILEKYCNTNGKTIKISNKIRCNEYISAFVERLKNKGMNFPNVIDKSKMGDYVQVHYYSSYHEAKILIEAKVEEGYKFLVPAGDRYHKSSYDNFDKLDFSESAAPLTTHSIIGGEFDKVITYIDNNVGYSGRNLVKKNNEYYYLENEIYVNMSRAREKLIVVVINNSELYKNIVQSVFTF